MLSFTWFGVSAILVLSGREATCIFIITGIESEVCFIVKVGFEKRRFDDPHTSIKSILGSRESDGHIVVMDATAFDTTLAVMCREILANDFNSSNHRI